MDAVVPYEQRLNENRRWALMEGSMHFENRSSVFRSLRRIAAGLERLGIAYAVVGGMALFHHGYRRYTENLDILVTGESLETIHANLAELGCVSPDPEKTGVLRDAESGVRVKFLVSGGYPGDGKPKPLRFPDPSGITDLVDGIQWIRLPQLVELKLAAGTVPWRRKDVGDVQELIDRLQLQEEFANQINEYVRPAFLELVRLIRDNPE